MLLSLTAGGYIDQQIGSENFGGFSVSAEELNLYNLDQAIGERLGLVKTVIESVDSSDTAKCYEVLENFHVACDPNQVSCSKANQQSFQASIDKVSISSQCYIIVYEFLTIRSLQPLIRSAKV